MVFSRKIITSTGFYRCCAPGASAPVPVKNQSPSIARYPAIYLKNVDAIGIAIPYSAIGGVAMLGH